jgi:hypothetical protein
MAAILPVMAGHDPVYGKPHREIATASRTWMVRNIESATDLWAVGGLDVLGGGELIPTPAESDKDLPKKRSPRRSKIDG